MNTGGRKEKLTENAIQYSRNNSEASESEESMSGERYNNGRLVGQT